MTKIVYNFNPYNRIYILIISLVGIFLSNSALDFAGLIIIYISFLIINKNISAFLRFFFIFAVPYLFSLIVVYLILLNPYFGAINYVLILFLRFVSLSLVFMVLLNIGEDLLVYTLESLGLNKKSIVLVLGGRSILEEVIKKTSQIYTAKYASGSIGRRCILKNVLYFPFMIKPLIYSLLLTSIQRSDSWSQKKIVDNILNVGIADINFSRLYNCLSFVVIAFWVIICIYNK